MVYEYLNMYGREVTQRKTTNLYRKEKTKKLIGFAPQNANRSQPNAWSVMHETSKSLIAVVNITVNRVTGILWISGEYLLNDSDHWM